MPEYRWVEKINPETGNIQAINMGSIEEISRENYPRFPFEEARCMLIARNTTDATGGVGTKFIVAEPCVICNKRPAEVKIQGNNVCLRCQKRLIKTYNNE